MRFCLLLLIVSAFAAFYLAGFDAAPVPDPAPDPGIFGSSRSSSSRGSSSRSSSRSGGYSRGGSRSRSSGGYRGGSSSRSRSGGSGWLNRTRNKLRRGRDKIRSKLGRMGTRAKNKYGRTKERVKSKYRRTKEKVKNKIRNWGHRKKPSPGSSGYKPSRTRRIWNKIRGKDKHGGSSGGTPKRRGTVGKIWDKIRGRNKHRPTTGGGSTYPKKGTTGVGIIGTKRKSGWKKKAKGLIKKLAASGAVRKLGKKIFAKITKKKPKYYSNGYGRHYWYGNRYYDNDPYRYHVGRNQMDQYNIMKCMYQMPSGGMPNEEDYNVNFEYEDGEAVQTIVFNCDKRYEVCCGLDCCPRPRRRWGWGGGRGGATKAVPCQLLVTVLVLLGGAAFSMLGSTVK